jgi:hypothetical protein
MVLPSFCHQIQPYIRIAHIFASHFQKEQKMMDVMSLCVMWVLCFSLKLVTGAAWNDF